MMCNYIHFNSDYSNQ